MIKTNSLFHIKSDSNYISLKIESVGALIDSNLKE